MAKAMYGFDISTIASGGAQQRFEQNFKAAMVSACKDSMPRSGVELDHVIINGITSGSVIVDFSIAFAQVTSEAEVKAFQQTMPAKLAIGGVQPQIRQVTVYKVQPGCLKSTGSGLTSMTYLGCTVAAGGYYVTASGIVSICDLVANGPVAGHGLTCTGTGNSQVPHCNPGFNLTKMNGKQDVCKKTVDWSTWWVLLIIISSSVLVVCLVIALVIVLAKRCTNSDLKQNWQKKTKTKKKNNAKERVERNPLRVRNFPKIEHDVESGSAMQPRLTFEKGEIVEIYSESKKKWLIATIQSINPGNKAWCTYRIGSPPTSMKKFVDLSNSKAIRADISQGQTNAKPTLIGVRHDRKALAAAYDQRVSQKDQAEQSQTTTSVADTQGSKSAMARARTNQDANHEGAEMCGFEKGQDVEIFSTSMGYWVPATITTLDARDTATVLYTHQGSQGQQKRKKMVSLRDEHSVRATAVRQRGAATLEAPYHVTPSKKPVRPDAKDDSGAFRCVQVCKSEP
jgi:hypothetical protein